MSLRYCAEHALIKLNNSVYFGVGGAESFNVQTFDF